MNCIKNERIKNEIIKNERIKNERIKNELIKKELIRQDDCMTEQSFEKSSPVSYDRSRDTLT